MSGDFDVLIVGGGAAGIAAARRLAASGISALLLEASARLGGRAWTLDIAGHPIDLGCGWLHSADRNPWTHIAEEAGHALDRSEPAWDTQYRDLGFSPGEQAAAGEAFGGWRGRLEAVAAASDRAADALAEGGVWNAYIRGLVGIISGAKLEALSAADYIAYDLASTSHNWRVPDGYGAVIAGRFPQGATLRLSTPVQAIDLDARGVKAATGEGDVRARCAILTVSTAVLAGGAIKLPSALDSWRHAATLLPLGRNEKLFLEIIGDGPFAAETHVLGNPRDVRSCAYYIRPFGRPLIECYLGADAARIVEEDGPVAAYAHALDELAALFGPDVRGHLRPLVASSWGRTSHIGGAYSYALPGHAAARLELARPYDERLFFAGEATHPHDFSTAQGAYESGVRAADEAMAALRGGA